MQQVIFPVDLDVRYDDILSKLSERQEKEEEKEEEKGLPEDLYFQYLESSLSNKPSSKVVSDLVHALNRCLVSDLR